MEQSKGKSSRQRGVILTSIGYQKLHRAKVNWEIKQNTRCTLDILSQHTGLTANTLSKIFSRSVAVDKPGLPPYRNTKKLTKPLLQVASQKKLKRRYWVHFPFENGCTVDCI